MKRQTREKIRILKDFGIQVTNTTIDTMDRMEEHELDRFVHSAIMTALDYKETNPLGKVVI